MIMLETPRMVDLLSLCDSARPDEQQQFTALTGQDWEPEAVANIFYNKPGVKFVAKDRGVPFVAGGWEPVIDGVYQSWMVGTMGFWESHWRSITKVSLKSMIYMFNNGARRLQTCVTADRAEACNWYIRGLKMRFEGLFEGFGIHGEDMAMFAKLKE